MLLRPLFAKVGSVRRCLDAMVLLTELARQGGITTMAEMLQGAFSLPYEQRLFDLVYNDPATPVRCVVVVDAKKAIASRCGSSWLAVRSVRAMARISTEKLIYNNGVKFITDDAFLGLTIQVGHPGYIDGHRGIWNSQPGESFARQMLPWWRSGARIHVHSNGDAAQDATAEALAALQAAHPRFDHRFCFEHFGMSNLSLVRRVKALGASASVNTYYTYLRAELHAPHLGADRAHSSSRLRLLLDEGVRVATHTDTPVAPPRPLEEMWIAVNRVGVGGKPQVFAPAERVTAAEALRMKTIDAAAVLGLDGLIGSIEAGKLADFTVLDEDPLAVPAERIRDIRICAPQWHFGVQRGLTFGLLVRRGHGCRRKAASAVT